MSNQLTEDEIDYEVDAMPEGYSPTLSGSLPMTLTDTDWSYSIGPYTLLSNVERSCIIEDGQQGYNAVSYQQPAQAHRECMIRHLKYLINEQGLTSSE